MPICFEISAGRIHIAAHAAAGLHDHFRDSAIHIRDFHPDGVLVDFGLESIVDRVIHQQLAIAIEHSAGGGVDNWGDRPRVAADNASVVTRISRHAMAVLGADAAGQENQAGRKGLKTTRI